MSDGELASLDRERLLKHSNNINNDTTSAYNELNDNSIKVYKKRWYILFIFCLLCIGQGIMYNTWAPIQSTARAVYKWESYMIDLMPALGCIAPCFTIIPLGWLMDVKGLRCSVLLASTGQFLGAALRCLPTINNFYVTTLLLCLGQTLSALVAPVALSGGVLVSSVWFPSNQRTISTAIIMGSSSLGGALSFLVGPLLIDDVAEDDILVKVENTYFLNDVQRQKYHSQINALFVSEAGLMAILFIIVYLHFPDRPLKPPSWSSGTQRADFNGSLDKILKKRHFISLALLYGVSCGVYSGWCSVLGQNLEEFGYGQAFSGWLGFIAVLGGAVSGIFFSIFASHFSSYLKEFLMLFMASASVSIFVMCLIFAKVIPMNTVMLCIVFGATGFFVNGALPFYFELGAEIAHPVAEGITSSIMKSADYVLQAIFLFISMAGFGAKWMTWVTMITCALTTVLLFFVKEKYNRLILDKKHTLSSD